MALRILHVPIEHILGPCGSPHISLFVPIQKSTKTFFAGSTRPNRIEHIRVLQRPEYALGFRIMTIVMYPNTSWGFFQYAAHAFG